MKSSRTASPPACCFILFFEEETVSSQAEPLNTPRVHLSSAVVGLFFTSYPQPILCMFHEMIRDHLLVRPISHVHRLRIITHLPDKSFPLCCSPNTFLCQSLGSTPSTGWWMIYKQSTSSVDGSSSLTPSHFWAQAESYTFSCNTRRTRTNFIQGQLQVCTCAQEEQVAVILKASESSVAQVSFEEPRFLANISWRTNHSLDWIVSKKKKKVIFFLKLL